MIDPARTLKLITGALLDRETTWRGYLPDAGDWIKTALLLTVPLIVVSAVVSYILSLVFGDSAMFQSLRPTLGTTLISIVLGAIAAGIVAFIFGTMAGVFGGKGSFPLALAATTLAFVPGYVGQALSWLPWIGTLLAIGLAIFALVQLWKIIPIYLEVPDSKRAMHYIVSLVVVIVVMLIIGKFVNPMIYGDAADSPFGSVSGLSDSDQPSGGLFSNVGRAAAIMEEAQKHSYTPPDDGKVSQKQMREYVAVMAIVNEDRAEKMKKIQELDEKTDGGENISISDIGTMADAMSTVGPISTLEMETVMDRGGNWAEHQWINESIRTAMMRRQGTDAIEHNFELFKQYREQLYAHQNQ